MYGRSDIWRRADSLATCGLSFVKKIRSIRSNLLPSRPDRIRRSRRTWSRLKEEPKSEIWRWNELRSAFPSARPAVSVLENKNYRRALIMCTKQTVRKNNQVEKDSVWMNVRIARCLPSELCELCTLFRRDIFNWTNRASVIPSTCTSSHAARVISYFCSKNSTRTLISAALRLLSGTVNISEKS